MVVEEVVAAVTVVDVAEVEAVADMVAVVVVSILHSSLSLFLSNPHFPWSISINSFVIQGRW